MGVSGNLWSFPNEAKPIVLYDGEWGIALKPMMGNLSSFLVDMGYIELFDIPEVTAVFLLSCDSFLGNSLMFHQAH